MNQFTIVYTDLALLESKAEEHSADAMRGRGKIVRG